MSTENLQLNLWEKPDRILMEDFNADNAKIDQYLGPAYDKAGMKLIKEVVLEEETAEALTLDLSDIDWGAYSIVCMDFLPVMDRPGNASVKFQGETVGDIICKTYALFDYAQASAQMWLFPLFRSDRYVMYTYYGEGESKQVILSVDYTELSTAILTLNSAYLNNNYHLAAGASVRVWGMK